MLSHCTGLHDFHKKPNDTEKNKSHNKINKQIVKREEKKNKTKHLTTSVAFNACVSVFFFLQI